MPDEDDDIVVALMKRYGGPMTRERYLDLAYFGNPPEELGEEEEAALPPQFRLGGPMPIIDH
jgi:hypothetical protein